MGSKASRLLSVVLPILGTLVAPGIGSALGSTLGTATLSGIGGAIGGASGGALNGGGLKGALLGGATGGAGGYLSGGGLTELFPETSNALYNTTGGLIGSSNGSGATLSNLLSGSGAAVPGTTVTASDASLPWLSGSGAGTGAAATNSLPWLSGSGSGVSTLSGLLGGSSTSPIALSSPTLSAGGTTGDFAKGLAGNGSLAGEGTTAALASPSLNAGIGGGGSSYGAGGGSVFGGGSSYGGLNTLASLLGGAASLNANKKAQKDLLGAQDSAIGQLQPYLDSGQASNMRLSELLGTGGNSSATDYGSLSKPFTPTDLANDPGYQFQLSEGNKALDRQESAKGNYFSGSALKAAQDYGQGLAGTTYNNAFQRNQAQKGQTYGMFSGQSGQGLNAAGGAANIYDNIGNAKANAGISSANILNQTLSSLLSGSGAKRLVGYYQNGQPIYA